MNTRVNIERSYGELYLEPVFQDQALDICLKNPPTKSENPCVIASIDDDKRAAIYASLFVAAPDLLAACKALDVALCNGFESKEDRHAGRVALLAARAAVAKAEGKQ